MKVWTKLTARLERVPEDWAVYAEAFERHGIAGTVQTDQPPTVSGYAFEPTAEDLESLRRTLLERGAWGVEVEEIEEQDWAEGWKQFFKPRRVGRRLVIVPSWEEYEAGAEDAVIVLDPGQAFGTGDHPTTRLCLELLEAIDLRGACIADIGCGSGILSIASVQLGASGVWAVDVERAAVESARENAGRNGVRLNVYEGRGFEPLEAAASGGAGTPAAEGADAIPKRFDVVLSNIISAALIQLAPAASRRLRRGGAWIVSGVIEANWNDVLAAAGKSGFRLEDVRREDGWLAAMFRL